MNTIKNILFTICSTALITACTTENVISDFPIKKGVVEHEAVPVAKSNNKKVYMHYMPWFEAKGDYSSDWGSHWTMTNKNPDELIDGNVPDIASHVHPLIGPYDSRDPDVINYHLLLMKYAGIDGLLINWYGTEGTNQDIDSLLQNSNAIIEELDDVGLNFSVVMEDRFANEVTPFDDITANIKYLSDNYYGRDEYIRIDGKPLTLIFGPFQEGDANWEQALAISPEEEHFIPLQNNTKINTVADGDFAWPGSGDISDIENYYKNADPNKISVGGAFPGFKDFYEEGGYGEVIVGGWEYPLGADQMKTTLDFAVQYESKIDFLQLITWNDFGEGTTIEPTIEYQFDFLIEVQKYTGVSYTVTELEMVYNWFNLKNDPRYQAERSFRDKVDQIYFNLVSTRVSEANDLFIELQ
ncbi:glycoside hydrolase family 71/99 protein [Flammeovirga kamogawensis]|uniref:Glycosyl hydrolase family 99 n=1 Tax=Flammeovirga kamogawensis TaxID=373891 RepID=A0ABX8H336_9BACT|nr:hypothetical protein [Flammeovirga kamogawensis]MBB6463290.1 hypothetical protein [Flammeovirga kamogawensis]QWG09560.1 hypothetical protein KM029_23415 [Flammeovirga kamogawensis]TRX65074.1 hypothetical protein EO216_21310 [Flammeovirga kamogawensis]